MGTDMSKAAFAKALERNGITEHGSGASASYDIGTGTVPVRGLFGPQLPSKRRDRLAALIEWKARDDKRDALRQQQRAQAWAPGDRAVISGPGRMHAIFISSDEERGRLRFVDGDGRAFSRARHDVLPHTKGKWKGPADLRDAMRRWHGREVQRLRDLEAKIEDICPGAIGGAS